MVHKPTRKQKIFLSAHKLNPDHWLVIKNPPGKLYIRNRKNGLIKIIDKPKHYCGEYLEAK